MSPIEISRENARREREAQRQSRKPLPPRSHGPLPAGIKEQIERIRAELERKEKDE